MTTHLKVGIAIDQYARAMSESQGRVISYQRERSREESQDNKIEHRHQQFFPEANKLKPRPAGQEGQIPSASLFQQANQSSISQPCISIQKEQPLAMRLIC